MDISIVIVNYKLSDKISNLLKSLIDIKLKHETIVVDNSCSNEEKYQLNALKNRYNFNIIFNNENLGFGKACNIGVNNSIGKNILFINPDSILKPNCAEKLLENLVKLNADAVGPKIFLDNDLRFPQPPFLPPTLVHIFFYNYLPKIYYKLWERYSKKFWHTERNLRVNFLSGSIFMVKKEYARFDERFFMYFEDADLFMKVKKVYFCPEAKAVHYFDMSPSSEKSSYFLRSYQQFLQKHYGLFLSFFPSLFVKKRFHPIEGATMFKEVKNLQDIDYLCDIALSSDFIPFTRGRLNFENMPEFVKNNLEKLWIKRFDVG